MIIRLMRVLLTGMLCCLGCVGAVSTLYVDERTDYKEGASFGKAGAYERITANATYGASKMTAWMEFLKPRDPALGNGTLLYVIGKGPDEKQLLEAGFSILRFKENKPEAVRDVVSYLRYGADSILLLSDQKRFQKRVIAFASGPDAQTLATLAQGGFVKDESGRKVFDVLWVHDSEIRIEPPPEVQVHITKGKPLPALALQLHESLKAGK